MHTSFFLVALMGPGAAPDVSVLEAPSWQTNYRTARAVAKERGKPLAIFVGSGSAGWDKLTEEGGLSRRSRQLLSENYVCTYVDHGSPSGRSLAEAFEITSGTGLIISTLDTDAQAFFFRGVMTTGELEETLQKFTSVNSIQRTETLSRQRYALLNTPDASMRPTTTSVVTANGTTSNVIVSSATPSQGSISTSTPVITASTTPIVSGSVVVGTTSSPVIGTTIGQPILSTPSSYVQPASYASPGFASPATYAPPAMAAPTATFGGFGGGFGGGFTSGGC